MNQEEVIRDENPYFSEKKAEHRRTSKRFGEELQGETMYDSQA